MAIELFYLTMVSMPVFVDDKDASVTWCWYRVWQKLVSVHKTDILNWT